MECSHCEIKVDYSSTTRLARLADWRTKLTKAYAGSPEASEWFLLQYFFNIFLIFFGGPSPVTRRYSSWPLARAVAPAARDG
jgi:hypothetical protein